MHRLKKFGVYCFVFFFITGCATTASMKQLSLPTPWGPIVIDFDRELKRGVQSEGDLKALPETIAKNPELAKDYYTFMNLGFALWVPSECQSHDSGMHFVLRPEYSAKLRQSIEKSIEEQKNVFGNIAVDTEATLMLLKSHAERYACGDNITINFVKGSVINGWQVTEEGLKEMKEIGGEKLVMPRRQIMITVAAKDKMFPNDFSLSPPNLMRWTSRFDAAYNIDSIYGDKDNGFLYERYRWSLSNVEIEGKPDRRFVIEGLRAYFVGNKFFYVVDLFAVQGETKDKDWDQLRQVLESFKFVKNGSF